MRKFKLFKRKEWSKLPEVSGVYAFKDKKEILYIGKSVNIKERVKNHFHHVKYREAVILPKTKLFNRVTQVGYIETDSEIAALILEANLIKKYKPKYNVLWKDDKNYFFVEITKEDFPRIFITHQPHLKTYKLKNLKTDFVGPFIDGTALKKTLRILRKIFPYYTIRKHPHGYCPWCHLGLCPGPNISKKEYKENIRNLVLVLRGKKKTLVKELKKEMEKLARARDFENAVKIRDQILALEKTLAHAKIFKIQLVQKNNWHKIQKILQKILKIKKEFLRIEAYDVSNIQGKEATGSMVTFIKGQPEKKLYRKFKIKSTTKPNDIAMLKEVLNRRFKHPEWGFPDLILIDGGIGQLSAALKVKRRKAKGESIKVISLAKRENKLYIENQKKPILLKNMPREIFNLILQLRDEAHRFAIFYHKKLREKKLVES